MKDFFNKLGKIFGSIGFIALIAFLGAEGGQGVKWVRRFILPAVITVFTIFVVRNWWCLSVYTISAWLSIGYGIPSYFGEGNPYNDEGSLLGRFFYKLFHNSELWANVFSRGTIGLLISLSMLSVPILKSTWLSFIAGLIIITVIWATIAWRNSGSIPVKIFGKVYTLLNIDLIVYGVTACGIVLIVYGFIG